MTTIELDATLTEIYGAFPTLKRRLNESSRLLQEWMRALRPLSQSLASEGISRWLWHHNTDPTLDHFMNFLDGLAEERRKREAGSRQPSQSESAAIIGDALLHAAEGAQDEHDKAWGRLHVDFFMKEFALDTPENRLSRAALYREFAKEHPFLAALALEEASKCEQ